MNQSVDRHDSPTRRYLQSLLDRYASEGGGELASYIPELASGDPTKFGIAMVTVDGAVYDVGDTRDLFTIQSVSKPFTFGLAIEERGDEAVRERIGVEPTGEAFNSITLSPGTGTPLNPMVNAGAITATGLIAEHDPLDFMDRILANMSVYAGRDLGIDEDVARSESRTGHRNRAIGHLLKGSGALLGDPDVTLEAYFRQCSVSVSCVDLAVMAATLANGGLNPMTGARAAGADTVRSVLSVMATCGMYNGAGQWLYEVGLPAKSGVSGSIIAVQPGQFGVAVFSPLLDPHGNSVRGVKVCEDVSRELALHVIQSGRRPPSPIHTAYTLADVSSKRVRPESDRELLDQQGGVALALELQGEITFASSEIVTRRLVDVGPTLRVAIVDLRRVDALQRPAVAMLGAFAAQLAEHGGELVLSGAAHVEDRLAALDATGESPFRQFSELDLALEYGENVLLAEMRPEPEQDVVELVDNEVLRGVTGHDLEQLLELFEPRVYGPGEQIFGRGDAADEMLFVRSGQISITVPGDDGPRRIITLGSGALLGEMALINAEPRTGDVRADTDVECHVLSVTAIDQVRRLRPEVRAVLLGNVLRIVARRADKVREELGHLGR